MSQESFEVMEMNVQINFLFSFNYIPKILRDSYCPSLSDNLNTKDIKIIKFIMHLLTEGT